MIKNQYSRQSRFIIITEIILVLCKVCALSVCLIPLYMVFDQIYYDLLIPVIIILIIILSVIYNDLNKIFHLKNCVELINDINPHLRNYYIALYDSIIRNRDMNIEDKHMMMKIVAESHYKLIDLRKIPQIIHILIFGVIINIFGLIMIPQYYANTLGISQKKVVLKPMSDSVELMSFNLGNVRGNIYVNDSCNSVIINEYKGINGDADVYFKGPHVKSNVIKYKSFNTIKPDSLFVLIYSPQYLGSKCDSVYSRYITVSQYSDIECTAYFGNRMIQFSVCCIKKDTIVSFMKNNLQVSVDIAVADDMYPIIGIIAEEDNIIMGNIVEIPYYSSDDHGIDNTGAVIIEGEDTAIVYSEYTEDSLYIVRHVLNQSINTQITCFTSDNNPFADQTSYSRSLIFQAADINKMIYMAADSLESLSYMSEKADIMIDRFEEIKRKLTNSDIDKLSLEFSELVNELNEINKDIDEKLYNASMFDIDESILEKLFEIKEVIKQINPEILDSIFKDYEFKEMTPIDREKAKQYIKENSELIIKELENLSKMLNQLQLMEVLMKTDSHLEDLIEKENQIIDDIGKQSEITEGLNEISNELSKSPYLSSLKRSIDIAAELSKEAEYKKEMSERVKNEMGKISDSIDNMLAGMNRRNSTDIMMLIMVLYTINTNYNEISVKAVYENLIEKSNIDNVNNPLTSMFNTAVNMINQGAERDEIYKFNHYIIAYLLNEEHKGQGQGQGMSMEQMMQKMKNMGKKEMAISQMLNDMMQKGEGPPQLLDEIGRMQNEMAEMIREMMKEGNGKAANELESIADSLDELAEKIVKGIDEELLNKENRILNRMLDFSKSMYKQGLSEKRESKSGKRTDSNTSVSPISKIEMDKKERMKLFDYIKLIDCLHYKRILRKYYMEILK